MDTPGLEYAADIKVEREASKPRSEDAAGRRSTNFQGLELYRHDQDKVLQEQFQAQWPKQASKSADFISHESKVKPTLSSRTRKSKVRLIGIIAAIVIAIIIAASVAGSLAARKHDNDSDK